jgi:hypothetical protein
VPLVDEPQGRLDGAQDRFESRIVGQRRLLFGL